MLEDRTVAVTEAYYKSDFFMEAIQSRYDSFINLSMLMNINPAELEQIFLAFFKAETAHILQFYENHPDDLHRMVLERVKDSEDFWLRVDAQELYAKATTLDNFMKYYKGAEGYRSKTLLAMLSILPYPLRELKTMNDLYDFLFQIPFRYSFELDFNAFLEQKPRAGKLPTLNFYYLLFTVLSVFIETVAVIILESDDNYSYCLLRTGEDIVTRSKLPRHCLSLISCITMLQGKSPVLIPLGIPAEASNKLHVDLVTPGQNFVTYHEIGHLVLGHLETVNSNNVKALEHEADEFAAHYLLELIEEHGEGAKFKIFLSLAALFVLLYCKEKLIPSTNQHLYPNASERFIRLAYCFSKDDRPKLAKAWNNVVMATDFVLKGSFEIEVPLCEVK
jgi:hypothetical protein